MSREAALQQVKWARRWPRAGPWGGPDAWCGRPECVTTLGLLIARAILTCKLRLKMDVGRLGGRWAARLITRPWGALENMFSPEQNCRKSWGPEATLAIYHRKLQGFATSAV